MNIIENAIRNTKGSNVIVGKDERTIAMELAVCQIIKYPALGIEDILSKTIVDLSLDEIRKLKDYKRYSEINRRLEELEKESCEKQMEKFYNATCINQYKTELLYPINIETIVSDRLEENDLQIFKKLLNNIELDFKNNCDFKQFIFENYPFADNAKIIINYYLDYYIESKKKTLNEMIDIERPALQKTIKSWTKTNRKARGPFEIVK